MNWRHWLIHVPTRVTEVGLVWFRLYFMVMLWVAVLASAFGLALFILGYAFGMPWALQELRLH